MNNPIYCAVAALLALYAPLCSSRAQDSSPVPLKFEHPRAAGEKSHESLKAVVLNRQRIMQGDKLLKEQARRMTVELSGVLDSVKVTAAGKSSEIAFTVEQFSYMIEQQAPAKPFAKGTVIKCIRGAGGKKEFSINGKPVEAMEAAALNEVVEIAGGRDTIDQDAVFGSTGPKKVGDEWPINTKALLASVPGDLPFSLTEKDLSGKVQFTGRSQVGGKSFPLLKMSVSLAPKEPGKLKGVPESFVAKEVSMKMSGTMLVPESSAVRSPMETMTMEMMITGQLKTPNGEFGMTMENTSEKERHSKAAE